MCTKFAYICATLLEKIVLKKPLYSNYIFYVQYKETILRYKVYVGMYENKQKKNNWKP